MKILLVTSHFYPEGFKANDMAFELVKRGHKVTVLTPIPDYPQGHYYKGYGIFRKQREVINGVKIYRTLVIPRHSGSAIWLGLNYMSYTLFSTLKGIWLGLFGSYDTVLVHETSPVMVGIPAVIVKKLQRVPMHFWVLDLWPESLEAAGGMKNGAVLGFFRKLTKWIYRNSDTIMLSSKGFKRSISKMGDFDKKLRYFPNWNDVKAEKSISDAVPGLPKGFNVLFAGNIGDAQDMPHIVEAANLLKNTNVNIILVGDGRRKQYVDEEIKRLGLTNLYTFGRFPIECMPAFFEQADVLLLALKDVPIFALTVPAKLQAYMASGKPIVAMINGEGADLVAEADCGWSVSAEDSNALADLLKKLATKDKSVLIEKGRNGLKFSQDNFELAKCIDNLESILNDKK